MVANATSGLPIGGLAADLLSIAADREPRIPDPWRPLSDLDPALLDIAALWLDDQTPRQRRPPAVSLIGVARSRT
ncbi:beta-lactamase [Actinoplanes sp. N902-109]|nr:beta-lactamase [Actinoplanes sp. N902-109]